MDANRKIVKIWCKNCFVCIKRYPIPICIIFLFLLLSYMLVPFVYTILIYSSPLVGISYVVHRVLLGIDRKKIQKAEQDDKRRKFAKSKRSFKSKTHLTRRNSRRKSGNINYNDDKDFVKNDDIFSKSLMELLGDKSFLIEQNPKKNIGEVNVESVIGRGECSSSSSSFSYNNYSKYSGNNVNDDADKDKFEGRRCWDTSEEDNKGVQDDEKHEMDLGLLETERNKRLESMMQRRRSRKNLFVQEKEEEDNNKNNDNNNVAAQISAIKVVKMNPFLEGNLCGDKNAPGSAPSSLLVTRNPFDLPYDPHEEKLDLSGDDFHEEFTGAHQKEAPMFCRHQSFSLGAFSDPDAKHDNHNMSFYKDLATKRFTLDGKGESVHEEDGITEGKTKAIDAYLEASKLEGSQLLKRNVSFDCGPSAIMDDRKADIFFFYGGKKRIGGHAPSNSIVSDMQVELSDEESTSLKDLDLEKERGSWLNLSNLSKVDSQAALEPNDEEEEEEDLHTNPLSQEHSVANLENNPGSNISTTDHVASSSSSSTQEMDTNRPHSLNSDSDTTVESNNQLQHGVTQTSPKSVLETGFSTNQATTRAENNAR